MNSTYKTLAFSIAVSVSTLYGASFPVDINLYTNRWERVDKQYFSKFQQAGAPINVKQNDDVVLDYLRDLRGWVDNLPLTNKFSRAVKENLGAALKVLHESFVALIDSDAKKMNQYLKQLKGLSGKYNLGTFAQLGDEQYIVELKRLLNNKVIPAMTKAYEVTLKSMPH